MSGYTFKRLPYGEQNFASVRTENYAYVDKTRYIEMLEKESNKRQFFIRPRKFGKSLFISMLSYYYDMLCTDHFQELFGGLYIGDNPTPRKNSYAVMKFDFSGLDTANPDNFIKSFNGKVQLTVQRFLEKYGSVFRQSDKLIDNIERNQTGVRSLEVAYGAAQLSGVKIFVIIDEYDHFANDLIAMGGGVVSAIQTAFPIDIIHDNEQFVSLLFYLGLLTIEKPVFGKLRLCIPNYSIKTVFWEYILRMAQTGSAFAINTSELDRSIHTLALDGQAGPFIDYVSRNIFNRLSNRDLQQFDEKYIKIMLLSCLFQSNIYIPDCRDVINHVSTETDSGYIDIYLRRSPLMPEVKYEWIFELKYLKAGVKKLEPHRLEARKQLRNYGNSSLMKDCRDLKKAVILFIGKNRYELFEDDVIN